MQYYHSANINSLIIISYPFLFRFYFQRRWLSYLYICFLWNVPLVKSPQILPQKWITFLICSNSQIICQFYFFRGNYFFWKHSLCCYILDWLLLGLLLGYHPLSWEFLCFSHVFISPFPRFHAFFFLDLLHSNGAHLLIAF